MKGGAAAAEIAFTAAQLAAGPAPVLHEAFIGVSGDKSPRVAQSELAQNDMLLEMICQDETQFACPVSFERLHPIHVKQCNDVEVAILHFAKLQALARCGQLAMALSALEDFVEGLPPPPAPKGPLPGAFAELARLDAAPAAGAAGGVRGAGDDRGAAHARRGVRAASMAASEVAAAAEAAGDAGSARAVIDLLLQVPASHRQTGGMQRLAPGCFAHASMAQYSQVCPRLI